MIRRAFGATGIQVPVVGQGTWKIEQSERSAVIAVIRKGLDLGMTHIDTAEMYGSGEAERIVGQAISGRRDEVFLVSKVLPENATAAKTRVACERSLRALNTDYLDCYLLHWPGRHPLGETIGAFEALKKQGKIRSWGVSNFDVGLLDEALAIAGPGAIACNQVLYHLQQRGAEHAVLPWCVSHGVALVSYSPYGQGAFPDSRSAAGRELAAIAAARGATPHQVALAFLTRAPLLFAIPKAARMTHLSENAGAGDLVLTADEVARIDAAFPRGARPRHLPTA